MAAKVVVASAFGASIAYGAYNQYSKHQALASAEEEQEKRQLQRLEALRRMQQMQRKRANNPAGTTRRAYGPRAYSGRAGPRRSSRGGAGRLRMAPIRRVQYTDCVGCAWFRAGERSAPHLSDMDMRDPPNPIFPHAARFSHAEEDMDACESTAQPFQHNPRRVGRLEGREWTAAAIWLSLN